MGRRLKGRGPVQRPILVRRSANDATTCATERLDSRRTMAVDTLFRWSSAHILLPATGSRFRRPPGLMASGWRAGYGCRDSPGFHDSARVMIVYLGLHCTERTATADVDKAVTLGDYPNVLSSSATARPARVHQGLVDVSYLGDPRTPHVWLARRASSASVATRTDFCPVDMPSRPPCSPMFRRIAYAVGRHAGALARGADELSRRS